MKKGAVSQAQSVVNFQDRRYISELEAEARMKLSEIFRDVVKDLDAVCDAGRASLSQDEIKEFEAMVVALEANRQLAEAARGARGSLEDILDDYFCRQFVSEVPKIVSRALNLRPLFARKIRTGPVEAYLEEALRCFVFGHFQAAVGLSRSALEEGLRESVRATLRILPTDDRMVMLLKAAERMRLMPTHYLQDASDVRNLANDVLHGQPCDEPQALEILRKTRRVLHRLDQVQ